MEFTKTVPDASGSVNVRFAVSGAGLIRMDENPEVPPVSLYSNAPISAADM